MITDAIGSVAPVAVILLIVVGWCLVFPRGRTLRQMRAGRRSAVAASVFEVVAFVAHLVDLPDDGPGPLILSAVGLLGMALMLSGANMAIAARGREVLDEAEQTVREWSGGAR